MYSLVITAASIVIVVIRYYIFTGIYIYITVVIK